MSPSRQVRWVFIASAVLFGCEPNSGVRETSDGPANIDPIPVEGVLISAPPAIGRPNRLEHTGDFLWVGDRFSDPGLHILNTNTGELLFSVGRRGEGPGDFYRSPSSLHSAGGDRGAIWVWDFGLQRFTRFEAKPLTDYQPLVVTLQDGGPVRRIAWLGLEGFVGVAHSVEDRFRVFSPDGSLSQTYASSLIGPADASLVERLEATDGGVIVREWPGRGFVIANATSARIEYYDHRAQLVRLAGVPDPWEPVFEPDTEGELRFIDNRHAYLSCTTTKDFLFALYSGRQDSLVDRDWAQSAETVHVFDWNGTLRAVYALDRDIAVIAASPTGKELIGASFQDAGIYRFRIPPMSVPAEGGE